MGCRFCDSWDRGYGLRAFIYDNADRYSELADARKHDILRKEGRHFYGFVCRPHQGQLHST